MNEAPKVEHANGQPASQVPLNVFLDQQLTPPVQFLVNGIITSMQNLPLAAVVMHLCRIFGRVIGACTANGDLAQALTIRRQCKEAFEAGISEVKIQAPAANQVAMTAMPKGR